MSDEFTKVRLTKETVAKIATLLESYPGAEFSQNSFSERAILAVIEMIEAGPGNRTEPDLVRVFDVFRTMGAKLPPKTPAPVSSPSPYTAADAMAVASAVAGRSPRREAPGSEASPKTAERSSDVPESPRGAGRASSPGRSLRAPGKAPRAA